MASVKIKLLPTEEQIARLDQLIKFENLVSKCIASELYKNKNIFDSYEIKDLVNLRDIIYDAFKKLNEKEIKHFSKDIIRAMFLGELQKAYNFYYSAKNILNDHDMYIKASKPSYFYLNDNIIELEDDCIYIMGFFPTKSKKYSNNRKEWNTIKFDGYEDLEDYKKHSIKIVYDKKNDVYLLDMFLTKMY